MTRLNFFLTWLSCSAILCGSWFYFQSDEPNASPGFNRPDSNQISKHPTALGETETEKILASSKADDLTVLRRLSLALTGTIPSVERIRFFESLPAEKRVEAVLNQIFESPQYGDYLAERFARVFVGVENGPFLVFRRRRLVDELSQMILANQPYDKIVKKIITAKGIWTSKPEVNFFTATIDPNNDKEGPDEVKLAARVSRAFLGVRIDCVQCHDDMIGDSWKQKDFHQLASFFAGTEMSITGLIESEKPYEFRYKRKSKAETVPTKVPFNEHLLPVAGSARERLANWVIHPENLPFARTLVNRIWALMFNQALIEPVDSIPLEGPYPPPLESLVQDTISHGFDLQRLIRRIAMSPEFQVSSRAKEAEPVSPFPLTRLRPEQVAGSIIQSASLETIDAESHILSRIIRVLQQGEFIKRYGDAGEEEFESRSGTIPQRLTLMNGKLVQERTEENLILNAATRIGALASNDASAINTAYLAVLTRRPSLEELEHFKNQLNGTEKKMRAKAMQDLYWVLLNSTEFAWNH